MPIIELSAIISFCEKDLSLIKKAEQHINAGDLIQFDQEEIYYMGTVTASLKDATYKVKITLNNGQISSALCTCPVGNVRCSHMITLLLYINRNVSSTDTVCSWKKTKPAKEGVSVSNLCEGNTFNPLLTKITENHISKFKEDLQNKNPKCGMVWLLEKEPIDFKDDLEDFYIKNGQNIKSLSVHEISYIEEQTRGQSNCKKWHKIRINRVTASNFGVILKAIERGRYPDSLFKKLKGEYKLDGIKAIQWGRENEASAIRTFEEKTKKSVHQCGIFLHHSGLIGASPDGLIDADELIEVKCPYSHRDKKSISEVVNSDANFF